MLELPEVGFQTSVDSHNVRLDVLADWVEASVLLLGGKISSTEVVDVLCENEVYRSQDFARERIGDAWIELGRRMQALGGSTKPVALRRSGIEASCTWREVPAYAFCLVVAIQAWFAGWARQFGPNYTRQGELFERIVEEALRAQGWSTARTGWSRTHPRKLGQVIQRVADELAERVIPGGQRWTKAGANEAGLDVLCFRPFRDGRGGRPVFLVQCASGARWEEKLGSPDLHVWQKLLDFSVHPARGFAIPFALCEDDFRHVCTRTNGLVLDRYRLLQAPWAVRCGWMTAGLRADLIEWLEPRIAQLPLGR